MRRLMFIGTPSLCSSMFGSAGGGEFLHGKLLNNFQENRVQIVESLQNVEECHNTSTDCNGCKNTQNPLYPLNI